jgi:hypothetical protein
MLIDCDQCVMQHTVTCDDCIVTVLLSGDAMVASVTLELGGEESHALRNLAEAGLVAPLRLVPRRHPHDAPETDPPSRGSDDEPGGPDADEVASG